MLMHLLSLGVGLLELNLLARSRFSPALPAREPPQLSNSPSSIARVSRRTFPACPPTIPSLRRALSARPCWSAPPHEASHEYASSAHPEHPKEYPANHQNVQTLEVAQSIVKMSTPWRRLHAFQPGTFEGQVRVPFYHFHFGRC